MALQCGGPDAIVPALGGRDLHDAGGITHLISRALVVAVFSLFAKERLAINLRGDADAEKP